MKFVAIQSNIKEAIALIERVVGENSNLPILKNALIKIENNTITFTATNLEIAVTCQVSGKIIESGALTVPLAIFSNIISNIQSDRLNFEKKGNGLEIKTDNYSAIIQGLPADDFPITPKIKNTERYLVIKGLLLREAIQQTAAAAQFSDLRPELNSVLFHFSLDNLKIAATDGFRLAEKTIPSNLFDAKKQEPFKILIPLKTGYEILRIVRDEDMVTLCHDENQVFIKTDRAEMISRLIEGNFPDYSGIIPKKFSGEIIVSHDDLLGGVKLAAVFGQKNGEIEIKVHPNKKALEIVSSDQSLGENNYVLPAKIKGDPVGTIFNWRYFSDPLKIIRAEEIFLGLQEEAGPAMIRSASDPSYFYIIKPILRA